MGREYTRDFTSVGLIPIAGTILFHDNFQGLLKFTMGSGIGDYIFELDPNVAFIGNQSLNMKTRVTGATTTDGISASVLTHLGPSKLLTQIVRFRCPDFSKIATLDLAAMFYDETSLNLALIRFTPGTPIFAYIDNAGNPQNITGSGINLLADAWHTAILKVNFSSPEYRSFSIDHHHFSLSGIGMQAGVDPTATHLKSQTLITTSGNAAAQLRLGDYSLTET